MQSQANIPCRTLTTTVTSTSPFGGPFRHTLGDCSEPPSPPSSVDTDGDWLPPSPDGGPAPGLNGILCTRSFYMTESFETTTLPVKPGSEDTWACQLVRTEVLDQDDSAWMKAISSFPFSHFVCVIGQTPCREFYVLGVASSRILALHNIGLSIRPLLGVSVCPWVPSQEEIRAHGVIEATQRSEAAFAKIAADSVRSRGAKGLADVFREITDGDHKHLLTSMESVVLDMNS